MTVKDQIHNIEIYKGSLWSLTIILKDSNKSPISLTGYSAYCEIRSSPGGQLLASPALTITAGSGQLYFFLTPAQTKLFGSGRAVYDIVLIEIADLTNTRPLLRGDVLVYEQITRPTVTLVGNVHNTTDLMDCTPASKLVVGMLITGTGVPAGTTILSLDTDHLHMSVVATADVTGASYVFSL